MEITDLKLHKLYKPGMMVKHKGVVLLVVEPSSCYDCYFYDHVTNMVCCSGIRCMNKHGKRICRFVPAEDL